MEVTLTYDQTTRTWTAVNADGTTRPARQEETWALTTVFEDDFREPVSAVLTTEGDQVFLQCADGPALIYDDGVRIWFRGDKRHRDVDLPAFIGDPQFLMWYVDGKFHREAGPARIINGTLEWYLEGKSYTDLMDALLADLRGGGVVPGLLPVPAKLIDGICELVDIKGNRVGPLRTVPSAGWVRWILANADEHYPELAAAIRARAMRQRLSEAAPPEGAQEPVTPARRGATI